MKINSFDIDGVIYMGEAFTGLRPDPDDIIITGRSIEERDETLEFLHSRGIMNEVFFNPRPYNSKTRETSGEHKVFTLKTLIEMGIEIGIHFEDDPVQIAIINSSNLPIQLVHINHHLIPKENFKHGTV